MRLLLAILLAMALASQPAMAQDEDVLAQWRLTESGAIAAVGDRSIPYDSWWVVCRADAMTDDVSCDLTFTMQGYFRLRAERGGRLTMALGPRGYPGTQRSARVDSGQVQTIPENGVFRLHDRHASLLSQIREGETLRFRWVHWPARTNQDEQLSLAGFSEALDSVQAYLARCERAGGDCAPPSPS